MAYLTSDKDFWDAEAAIKSGYTRFPENKNAFETGLANRNKMATYLERCQISMEDIDKLNIIHVTGTKGKGSTCTFTESILRSHGYKTGLFLTPHLINMNERVKISGTDLSKDMFAKYFWEVNNRLLETKDAHNGDLPWTFPFYAVLAFYIFVKEKVDVCIVEIGIGGEVDATNFIRNTWVCAITSIGLDHIEKLGDTREKIAWHKSGIFKPGAVGFVGNIDSESVLQVIKSRAIEKNIDVFGVPALSTYETGGKTIDLGIHGDVQKYNASLALQICKAWLSRKENQTSNTLERDEHGSLIPACKPFPLTDAMLKGLAEARIICRGEIIRKQGVTYYVDIAHTKESLEYTCQWFFEQVAKKENNTGGRAVTILIYDSIQSRDLTLLLTPFVGKKFDAVVFTSDNTQPGAIRKSRFMKDETVFSLLREKTLKSMKVWHRLNGTEENEDEIFNSVRDVLVWASQFRDPHLLRLPEYPLVQIADGPECNSFKEGNRASIQELSRKFPVKLQDEDHIHVLVTGNTKLAGNAYLLASPDQ